MINKRFLVKFVFTLAMLSLIIMAPKVSAQQQPNLSIGALEPECECTCRSMANQELCYFQPWTNSGGCAVYFSVRNIGTSFNDCTNVRDKNCGGYAPIPNGSPPTTETMFNAAGTLTNCQYRIRRRSPVSAIEAVNKGLVSLEEDNSFVGIDENKTQTDTKVQPTTTGTPIETPTPESTNTL